MCPLFGRSSLRKGFTVATICLCFADIQQTNRMTKEIKTIYYTSVYRGHFYIHTLHSLYLFSSVEKRSELTLPSVTLSLSQSLNVVNHEASLAVAFSLGA